MAPAVCVPAQMCLCRGEGAALLQVELAAVELKTHTSRQQQLQQQNQWASSRQLSGMPQDTLLEIQTMVEQSREDYKTLQGQFVDTLSSQEHVDLRYLIFSLDIS